MTLISARVHNNDSLDNHRGQERVTQAGQLEEIGGVGIDDCVAAPPSYVRRAQIVNVDVLLPGERCERYKGPSLASARSVRQTYQIRSSETAQYGDLFVARLTNASVFHLLANDGVFALKVESCDVAIDSVQYLHGWRPHDVRVRSTNGDFQGQQPTR